MSQNTNKKVFGLSTESVGKSSMLFSVKSPGFKAVQQLKDSEMIVDYLKMAANIKKNITDLDYLVVNFSFGRSKDGNCVTSEFMNECPYLLADSSVIECSSPGKHIMT